jgi:cytochrome c peroxidase
MRPAGVFSVVCWLLVTGSVRADSPAELRAAAKEQFGSLEPVDPSEISTPQAELGRALFWDTRLSGNGQVACASCHTVEDWGADRRPQSLDARNKLTARHSQTVFNSMLQPTLRWVGDRPSGQQQAEKSLTGSMGFSKADEVIPLLKQHGYEARFQATWPGEENVVSPAKYAAAIQAYEKTLRTPAAFDRFLEGADDALTHQQQTGLRLFIERGCADCHNGVLLGGNSLQVFGVKQPYSSRTGSTKVDAGFYEVTKKEEDRNRFRVSMLRNISKTAPYFHDGSVPSLNAAIQVMAETQLGETLTANETELIAAFLESLSGNPPENYSPPDE